MTPSSHSAEKAADGYNTETRPDGTPSDSATEVAQPWDNAVENKPEREEKKAQAAEAGAEPEAEYLTGRRLFFVTLSVSLAMLIAALGQRVDADGSRTTVTDGRYAVSVVRTADGWRAAQITSYGS